MIKSYSFYCKDLNDIKYQLLLNKARDILDFKNKISQDVCNNFLSLNDKGKFFWITYFRTQLPSCNNQDISNAITDVYTTYENKRNKLNELITFQYQKEIKYTYYKNNGKTYQKGDVRLAEVVMGSNKVTKCLTYLTRYWNDGFLTYLEHYKDAEPTKAKLRNDSLELFKKYPERIKALILSKREQVVKLLTDHPIVFKSLSFRSCTEMTKRILNRNKNEKSIYGAIITLSGQKTEDGKLHIPVKYSVDYHGDIDDYDKKYNSKNQKTISYTLCFYKDKIRFVLGKELPEEQEITGKTNFYGIDVNIKNNLFADRSGNNIDYDRKIFSDYVDYLKKMDKIQNNKKKLELPTNLNKKQSETQRKWLVRIKDELKRKSSLLVKQAISLGKDHIVMEDLGQFAKSYARSIEYEGFKYGRLIRMLNLTDLKNIVKSIANKKGLQVTFVQSHFTSQTCPVCGHISRDNRPTQEIFDCVECSHKVNADTNSAQNIENRLSVDVLRDKLLLSEDSVYKPKKLGKYSILTILYDYYSPKELNKNE
jgi:putative transposase